MIEFPSCWTSFQHWALVESTWDQSIYRSLFDESTEISLESLSTEEHVRIFQRRLAVDRRTVTTPILYSHWAGSIRFFFPGPNFVNLGSIRLEGPTYLCSRPQKLRFRTQGARGGCGAEAPPLATRVTQKRSQWPVDMLEHKFYFIRRGVLLCFIDPRVTKIINDSEASSCPGIFSRTLRFCLLLALSLARPGPHPPSPLKFVSSRRTFHDGCHVGYRRK